jgi:predicted alpha-1,2-mannosidase
MKVLSSTCLPLLILLWTIHTIVLAQPNPITYVNTMIGTAPANTMSARQHSEAGSELKGQTMPAVSTPYAMTQWTAQTRATETKCVVPYYYDDKAIQGFRGTHWLNGSCVQDYGSATIMAISGDLKTQPQQRASRYEHSREISTPAFYQVQLDDYAIKAEMTSTTRCGLLRFSFENNDEHYILLEPNSDEGQGYVEIFPEKGEIVGYNPVHRIYQGAGESAGFSGYFVLQFDKPFSQYGTWHGSATQPRAQAAKGEKRGESMGAYVSFGTKAQSVTVRVGTSFTGVEGARQNLRSEVADFDFNKIKEANEAIWNKALGKMLVQGNHEDKVLFYSTLYRTKLTPRLFSDVDGSYPAFAGGTPTQKADGFDYYDDFSLWDTFRAALPLHGLMEPQKTGDMMQSLVKKAEQGGWMPIFPCWNSYTAAMIGDHVLSVMADAYAKGIRNFDVKAAYPYLRKNAFDPNPDPKSYAAGQGRRALDSYLKYGYVPLEDNVLEAFHKREQTSRTLEYAYDDFCLSTLAESLGHTEDAAALRKRALNYKNVIDPVTGYARGRHADGRWSAKFDPFASRASFITEGSPAQYTFFVPHDVAGLMQSTGGQAAFVNKLDTLFEQGYYWHGNEPNHQIAYLYAYAAQPWKTQKQVREIIYEEYATTPGGLSGNEDGGQMSAWLAFSMAGLYPVCPGTPYYVLGSPVFEEVAFKQDNGKTFKIKSKNNTRDTPYIQSATLNGKPFTRTYLTHQEISAGGTLKLVLGKKPNKTWGINKEDAPPTNFE